MSFGYSDIVVTIMKVNFHVNHGAVKTVEEVIDEGDGVATLFHGVIECSVSDAKAKSTAFLLGE